MLNDILGMQKFIKHRDVSLFEIVHFTNSDFISIQKLALEILNIVIRKASDENMHRLLVESNTIQRLLDILEVSAQISLFTNILYNQRLAETSSSNKTFRSKETTITVTCIVL